MKNKFKGTHWIAQGAVIAALYTTLTYLTSFIPSIGGVFQFRIAEALTILPYFTSSAIPGLAFGCFMANLLTGAGIYDVVFGTLATLIGAIGTYLIRRHSKYLSALPPLLSNTLIMPIVIALASSSYDLLPFLYFSVFSGEVVCCGVLGIILLIALEKRKIFKKNN